MYFVCVPFPMNCRHAPLGQFSHVCSCESAAAKFYKTRRLQWRDSFCRIKNRLQSRAACFPDSTHVTASTYTLVTPWFFLRKNTRYFRTGYGGKKSIPEEDWNRLRSRLVLLFSPPEHQFHERIDSHCARTVGSALISPFPLGT